MIPGLVFDYLAIAAKESDFLAHQLIWNTQTYTEVEDVSGFCLVNSSQPGELGLVAAKLRDKIMQDFDALVRLLSSASLRPQAEERYRKEFSFFEQVTSISGVLLKNAETKEARKVQRPLREPNKMSRS